MDIANWRVLCEEHHKYYTEQLDKHGEWGEARIKYALRWIYARQTELLWKIKDISGKNNFWGSRFLEKKIFWV